MKNRCSLKMYNRQKSKANLLSIFAPLMSKASDIEVINIFNILFSKRALNIF